MCFWKKKKKTVIVGSKYNLGDFVLFKNKRDEATNGYIYNIKQEGDTILYDIQVGGECPAIIENIPEDKVILKKK